MFMFLYASNLLIQWAVRLTLAPVQTQVDLHSYFLLFIAITNSLLDVVSWRSSFCGTVGENSPSSIEGELLAADINNEITGDTEHM